MNRLKLTLLFFLLSISILPSFLSAQNFTLQIANGNNYGCILQNPANLLVSLASKSKGKILPFDKELKKLSVKNRNLKKKITSLKNRSDRASRTKLAKLKRDLRNKKILIKEILSCRDGIIVKSNSTDCSLLSNNGSFCDDGNPCTSGDSCVNGKCLGAQINSSGIILNCGFDNCSRNINQCSEGFFTACFSGVAGNEICNNLDDDCNGAVDEVALCLVTPSATPTIAATATPTAISTATPTITPTATRTATPVSSPFTCIAPKIPGSNNNPNGCPCNTNGDCIGDCQCGNPCNNTTNPCASGTTCLSNGSCSGICLPSIFSRCVGASGNTPICVNGNTGNLSAAGCPCTINGNCIGDCKCGNPCNNTTNPCDPGTTCLQNGSCSGVCKPSALNACT